MAAPLPIPGQTPPAPAKLTYAPEPYEQPYYAALFGIADVERTGQLRGNQAVQFLSRSKLPMETLKNVWTLSDQPSTNFLDFPKFAVAIRLIQCLQNGVRGQGPTLTSPPGVVLRPAMFEGVSGVAVPLPSADGAAPKGPEGGPTSPTPPAPPVQQQQQQPPPQQQQLQAPPQTPTRPEAPSTPQPPPTQIATPPGRGPPPPSPGTGYRPPPGAAVPSQGPPPGAAAAAGGQPGRPPLPPHMVTPQAQPRALVTQDPYTMSHNERARYEGIFPEYCVKENDPHVYGKEAVELFSKSGMPQQQLAAIWNMVDIPVDNRLDALEFALAMHLIVCVTKKSLPMPPQLPPSLMQLKQAQAIGPPPSPGGPPPKPAAPAASGPPPPAGPPAVESADVSLSAPPEAAAVPSSSASVVSAPPQVSMAAAPSPATGTLSIDDAFAGLSPTAIDEQSYVSAGAASAPPGLVDPSLQQYQQPPLSTLQPTPEDPSVLSVPQPQQQQYPGVPPQQYQPQTVVETVEDPNAAVAAAAAAAYGGIPPPQQMYQQAPPAAGQPQSLYPPQQQPVLTMAPEPPSVPQPAAQDDTTELESLKGTLQKLQAENISLKAQLGHMTDDEREAQNELRRTIAEIARLSAELTELREQVMASKAKLLSTIAELKTGQEKVGMMTDLIAEANATKMAIDDATLGLQGVSLGGGTPAAAPVPQATVSTDPVIAPPAPTPAPVVNNILGGDLFSFDPPTQPTPAPVPVPDITISSSLAPPSAPVVTVGETLVGDVAPPIGVVETVSTDTEQGPTPVPSIVAPPVVDTTPESALQVPPLPSPQEIEQQTSQAHQIPAAPSIEQQQPAPQSVSPPVGAALAGATPVPFSVPTQPDPGHNRNLSTASFAFTDENILGVGSLPTGPPSTFNLLSGGDPAPVNPVTPVAPTTPVAAPIPSGPSEQQIAELKMKAREAEDVAKEAEESSRAVQAQVAELRRVADEAEAEFRKQTADDAGEKKKKGLFRGGNKKKEAKEAERLAQDARTKKDALLQAQSQANDAQAFAMETRREAERLRTEAEEAELNAAAAASMLQQQQQQQQAQAQAQAQAAASPEPPKQPQVQPIPVQQQPVQYPVPVNGGYVYDAAQVPPAQAYNPAVAAAAYPPVQQQQTPAPQVQEGQPAQPGFPGGYATGYNPNVMSSGGGFEIPDPSNDPYPNPF